MNAETESRDCVVFEFHDTETPPEINIQPVPGDFFWRHFRQQLFGEFTFSTRGQELDRLRATAREEQRECLRSNDPFGVALCLANLALMAKVKGGSEEALELAKESSRLATQLGLPNLASLMREVCEALGRKGNGV